MCRYEYLDLVSVLVVTKRVPNLLLINLLPSIYNNNCYKNIIVVVFLLFLLLLYITTLKLDQCKSILKIAIHSVSNHVILANSYV